MLLAGLVWAGGSSALTLGNLEVSSGLGQPLAGIVRIDAAAGEAIRSECFSPGAEFAAMPGIPTIQGVRFKLERIAGETLLRIASAAPVREPLAQVILQLSCPGLPSITRAFLVLLDPSAIAETAFEPTGALNPEIRRRQATPRRTTVSAELIAPNSRYSVRTGDTLSGIASRIEGRPSYSVWPLARHIYAANPSAFENGRPDRLIAGATLAIPALDSIASPPARGVFASRAAGFTSTSSVSPLPAVQGSRRPAPDREIPVIVGTPYVPAGSAGSVELEYLVLTPTLSDLSRSRVRQRASMAKLPGDPKPAPPELIQPPLVGQVPDAGWSSMWWWGLLLGALLLVLAVPGLFYYRLRKPTHVVAETGIQESPWEVEDEENPEQEMVYDDFEGTFVPKNPAAFAIHANDPEDGIQTHLMPALTIPRPDEETPGPDLDLPFSAAFPAIGLGEDPGKDDKPIVTRPPRTPKDSGMVARELTEADSDGEGWVDLDFEATQILEQDYLAEYAASLKERVKEQSGAHDILEARGSGAEESEVLLEASDLMDALGEDDEEITSLQFVDPDSFTTREMDALQDEPSSDDDSLSLKLDDNVIAIESGKKIPADDDKEQGGKQFKGSRKKT